MPTINLKDANIPNLIKDSLAAFEIKEGDKLLIIANYTISPASIKRLGDYLSEKGVQVIMMLADPKDISIYRIESEDNAQKR